MVFVVAVGSKIGSEIVNMSTLSTRVGVDVNVGSCLRIVVLP